jgi:hypothetical protein
MKLMPADGARAARCNDPGFRHVPFPAQLRAKYAAPRKGQKADASGILESAIA